MEGNSPRAEKAVAVTYRCSVAHRALLAKMCLAADLTQGEVLDEALQAWAQQRKAAK
jgi:hypothetical protein